jgi:fumarate hydratase subunit beta
MTANLIKTHRLRFPISDVEARQVRVGDQVIIDGEIIITAGLPTHERLLKCLDGQETPPMDLMGASFFHLGGYGRECGNGVELVYINPTTSTRFNPMMPRLIEGFGWHAVGGKGGLDEACTRAMQNVGCIYLSFLGGGAALLSRAIKEVLEVGWSDMLLHYRLTRVRVEGLGPTTVAIDAHGRSLYAEQQETAEARIHDLLAQLDSARRYTSQS